MDLGVYNVAYLQFRWKPEHSAGFETIWWRHDW